MADSPKQFFENEISARLSANTEKAKSDIGASYKFIVEGDGGGEWLVDGKDNVGVHEGSGKDADCTVTIESTDFMDLITGKANGQMLFMSGKLKIAGDMSLAMKLQQVLSA